MSFGKETEESERKKKHINLRTSQIKINNFLDFVIAWQPYLSTKYILCEYFDFIRSRICWINLCCDTSTAEDPYTTYIILVNNKNMLNSWARFWQTLIICAPGYVDVKQ